MGWSLEIALLSLDLWRQNVPVFIYIFFFTSDIGSLAAELWRLPDFQWWMKRDGPDWGSFGVKVVQFM